jgi:hypothetical protein
MADFPSFFGTPFRNNNLAKTQKKKTIFDSILPGLPGFSYNKQQYLSSKTEK